MKTQGLKKTQTLETKKHTFNNNWKKKKKKKLERGATKQLDIYMSLVLKTHTFTKE